MSALLEPQFVRRPRCPCGSRDSADHGSKGNEVFQRRRCKSCGRTFHAFPIGWVRWLADGTPVLVKARPQAPTPTATPPAPAPAPVPPRR